MIRAPNFDINEFVAAMFSSSNTWEKIFWRLWGIVNHLKCEKCGKLFACADLVSCRSHPVEPTYPSPDAIKGLYKCCHGMAMKFTPFYDSHVTKLIM
jgi:hypothetical protein